MWADRVERGAHFRGPVTGLGVKAEKDKPALLLGGLSSSPKSKQSLQEP